MGSLSRARGTSVVQQSFNLWRYFSKGGSTPLGLKNGKVRFIRQPCKVSANGQNYGPLAQLVEQQTLNLRVVGSNPTWLIKKEKIIFIFKNNYFLAGRIPSV